MDEFRKYKPMVYVCSPYSGDTQYNTAQAKKYSRFAYEQGAIPMTPHLLYPQFMCDENPAERSDAMHFNYVLLGNCSDVRLVDDAPVIRLRVGTGPRIDIECHPLV